MLPYVHIYFPLYTHMSGSGPSTRQPRWPMLQSHPSNDSPVCHTSVNSDYACMHAHSKNRIVILTRGLLFEFQMRKHITCMDTEWISFCLVKNAKTYFHYRHIIHMFSFLNSLCNSGNKPLVNMTIPFYTVCCL